MQLDKRLEQAWTEFSMGNYGEAEELCRIVAEANPRDLQARYALSIITHRTGRLPEALAWAEAALKVEPTFGPVLVWQTVFLLEAGRTDEAILSGQKAVSINKRDPDAYNYLGRAFYAKGQMEEALHCFQQALRLKPNEAELHHACGSILSSLSRDTEAEAAFRQAVLLAPTSASLASLAALELKLGQTEEAVRFARRATKRDPQNVEAHVVLAQALAESGDAESAKAAWNRALEVSPQPAETLLRRAGVKIEMGQFSEAIADLERSIDENPNQVYPYFSITHSKRISESDRPLVTKIEYLIQSPDLSVRDQRYLHYSLGKSFDNLGQYERAIHHYDAANRLYREAIGKSSEFNREEFLAVCEARKAIFDSTLFERARSYGNPSQQPIFVLGMMRSGTTLAEQILSCHPEVGASGEQPFWVNSEPSIVDFMKFLVDFDALKTHSAKFLDLITKVAPGFPRVIDKNPANITVAGLLHAAYPNAKIIHTRRNPVDVALSIWMTPMETSAPFVGDKSNIVFAYKEILRLANYWKSALPPDQFLEVEYESLITNPEEETRRLVSFCNLGWNDLCLRPEMNQRAVKTPSFWQVRQPVYRSSMDRWRRYEPWLGEFRDLINAT
jgi:tetratricopeptide (TPR) repeat protein